jgi:hypothetical protein
MTAPKRFKLTAPVALEFAEQVALFRWAAVAARQDARLALLFAVPNGLRTDIGAAVKMKKAGMKRGIPDVILPIPNQGYHGLFLELKRKTGVLSDLSPEQQWWIERLTETGYKAAVAFGWVEAVSLIADYLKMPQNASQAVLEASSL